MIRLCLFCFLALVPGCVQLPPRVAPVTFDSELQRLQQALDSATTQTDMNLASGKIADFWDARLAIAERQVEKKLTEAEQSKFAKTKELWRNYRIAEVKFQVSLWEGGSIQPLVANQSYSGITEQRVADLETFLKYAFIGRE
jgi:uncharacterized protein YecT (DUF1311 family)